jgi:ATP-binding cassette subfamily G (WHITE) protein 2 (SNQ2)
MESLTLSSKISTSWLYQVKTLWGREVVRHWRDPTYLLAKLALNVVAALFVGFTFFKAKDSIQGTQNKIFVSCLLSARCDVWLIDLCQQAVFMSLVMGPPLANQLQGVFFDTRRVYEIRERPSRMYSWTALITAQILGEVPLNIVGSSIYFLIWYWLVGLPSSRAGYTYLMMGVVLPMFYTTFALFIAAMSPNPPIAAQLFGFFFGFIVTL